MSTTPATHRRVITRKVVDWAAWDWGSAAFNAVATTFVFTTYLATKGVFTDDGTASSWLSIGMTIAGLFIALLAPITGQRADRRGRGGVRGLLHAGRGGAGAWRRSPVSCERSRNGECCHAKGAGDHQGECRRSAVGHLSLTSLTTVFDKLGTKSASTIMGSFPHLRSMRCR